jgi:type VI protein secretion system component VasK
MPRLAFTVRLSGLDPLATRFYLNLDDQRSQVMPGAEMRWPVVWPGDPQKPGILITAFEDRVAAPEQALAFEGPWAWFELIDAATPSAPAQPEGDLATALRVQTKYHSVMITIEASDARRNPFAARDWRQFGCEP